jgi:hypothetical protein
MIGLNDPRYHTRAQTEGLLALSLQVAARGTSHAIEKIEPAELSEFSEERMLAVFGKMIKVELLRRSPASEREFIARFFRKRLLLMSLQSRFRLLSEISKEEYVQRGEQAIIDFDGMAFDVGAGKYDLERAIIPFVLPNFDPARSYMKEYHADPYIGRYVRGFVDAFGKIIDEKAANWN